MTAESDSTGSRHHKPFIPSWLDDYGLTASQFRVICHLWRSNGPRGCFPSAVRIRKICQISKNTVWRTLRDLEALGLITRRKFYRNANSYVLTVPSVGAKEGVTQPIELAQSEGLQLAQSEGRQLAQSRGCQLAQKRGHKGYPVKGIQLRVSSEGVADHTHTPSLRLVLSDSERQQVLEQVSISEAGAEEAVRTFNQNKANYPKDPRDVDAFIGWLRTSKDGKAVVARHRAAGPAGLVHGADDEGPRFWEDFVRHQFPNFDLGAKTWTDLDTDHRKHIRSEYEAAIASKTWVRPPMR